MPEPHSHTRCAWCGSDPLYCAYHDGEWGVPSRDERHLFEMLILEGARAGLSWLTILRKREGYRTAFDGFDPERIARYDDEKIACLLADPGIVRNRLKVNAAVTNARAWIDLQERGESPTALLWSYVDGEPRRNARGSLNEIPTRTAESDSFAPFTSLRFQLPDFGLYTGSTSVFGFVGRASARHSWAFGRPETKKSCAKGIVAAQ